MTDTEPRLSLSSLINSAVDLKNYLAPRFLDMKSGISGLPLTEKGILAVNILFMFFIAIISVLGNNIALGIDIGVALSFLFSFIVVSVTIYILLPQLYEKIFPWLVDLIPYVLIWLVYSGLSNVEYNLIYPRVHTEELYNTDKKLFSWLFYGKTPNEALSTVSLPLAVEFFIAFIYLLHTIIPLFIAIVFVIRKDLKNFRFMALSFAIVSLLSFITYIVYPAAAPWYIQKYGFTPPNPSVTYISDAPAHMVDLDKILGINLFYNFYSMEKNSFASMPSVHMAYATITLLIAYNYKRWSKKSLIVFVPYTMIIFFDALYFYHHFVIDLIIGIIYSIVAYYISKKITNLTKQK